MVDEPFGHIRRQASADAELQFLPLLSANPAQSLRRTRLAADRAAHDAWRGLAAHPDAAAGALQRRAGAAAREMARIRARARSARSLLHDSPARQGPADAHDH